MVKFLLACLSFFLVTVTLAQNFTLTVNNGYGSGSYKAGETVHEDQCVPARSMQLVVQRQAIG